MTMQRNYPISALFLALACNSEKPHGDHVNAKTTEEQTPAKDPHAGHVVPTGQEPGKASPTPADPHAGHAMPTTTGSAAPAAGYDLVLSTEPKSPTPNVKTRLVLDPRSSSGSRIDELAIVHEKPLHLILVTRDLSFFAHEHPERQPDGTYALDFTFPAAGEYVLFGDFMPAGATGQIVRMPVTVEGAPPPAKPLMPEDRATPKRFGALAVSLAPSSVQAGADTMAAFTITRDGKPETGLRPYLGAMGHCVIIDETATKFLHSHPQEQGEGAGPTNVVQFHTVFPDPGKYKVWGQFDVDGQMLIADFVVDVAAGGPAAAPVDPHAGHPH